MCLFPNLSDFDIVSVTVMAGLSLLKYWSWTRTPVEKLIMPFGHWNSKHTICLPKEV